MIVRPISEADGAAFERAYADTQRDAGANWIWLALCTDDGTPVVFVPVRPALEVGTVAKDPEAVGANPIRLLREFGNEVARQTPVFKRSSGDQCTRRLHFLGGDVAPTGFRYDGA